MEFGPVVVPLILLVAWFVSPYCESKLVEDEVATLERIALTMGSRYWKFDDTSCQVKTVGISSDPPTASNSSIHCNCQFANNSCHVVGIVLKGFNLPGSLPPELASLPYLRYIDFAFNFLSGEIPKEWASLQLEKISLIVNRISGEIPKFLGSMTSLTYLSLESNRFSGKVPAELGNLTNMETLILSSNQFMGSLPTTLERLTKLKDFRINDNYFSGAIPNLIRSWKQLVRLEMHASGFDGPIPPEISTLEHLTRLRISDINGTTAAIPLLKNMRGLKILVLRNCNIYGKIPAYLFNMENLMLLDLSFNKLIGDIPTEMTAKYLKVIYLSGNSLTGNIPSAMLNNGMNIDLSYNNLTRQNPNQPSCQEEDLNSNINLFRSSSTDNALRRFLPCLDRVDCPRYGCSFHVNCGGDNLIIKGDEGKVIYEGDSSAPAGNAIYFKQSSSNWGFSSFGDFMDDNNFQNIRHITSLSSTNMPILYTTSRLTPISLAYFGYCLESGNYTVTLHFAEIQFTNDNTYDSLGRRIFDLFIQDQLVQKNFNIKDEAHGARKPLIKQYTASVTDGTLEIRFYWAGKGTTRVPMRGVYGPLISAISVTSDFRHCSNGAKSKMLYIISGAVGLSLVILACFILWWKCHMRSKAECERDHSRTEIPKGSYSLKQIKDATDNFNIVNKIGEGGFGTVYKGLLPDGSIIAVKQLSSTSKQGNRQFLNEIAMISCLQHPNLVKLHGCCAEGDQLLLVYEYMENNSLASSLFGSEGCTLDWPTRVKIMLGVARGLMFLNEESRLKIVHRDIKATNVLLDRDFNACISDFGLAKLGDEGKTHISTRVAGTIGYMAPEYALWGYLTNKADVYSFGILALEIVSGKSNNHFSPPDDFFCLLDWACHLQQRGEYRDFVDEKLGSEVKMEEAERMVKVALLCTNGSPSLRPAMSEVVRILEGETDVPEAIPEAGTFSDDLRFKAMRDVCKQIQHEDRSISCCIYHNSTTILTTDAHDASFSATVSN